MLQKRNKNLTKINIDFVILAVILLGLALRLVGIFRREIWYDEAFSLLFGNLSWNEMLTATLGIDSSGAVSENHPLGYYVLLSGWLSIFGNHVWAARMLSVIFGGLSLWGAYLLSKLVLPKRLAVVPVIVLAVSPFHIHYSQEIRMYALMALALTIATWALFKGMQEDKWVWWGTFALASAAAQYTQQLASIYLIALAAIPLLRKDIRSVKRVFLSGLVAILLYLPWLVYLPDQIASTKVYWVERPMLSRFFTLQIAFVSGLPIRDGWTLAVLGISLLVVVFGLIATFRILKSEQAEKFSGLWFGYLAIAPPVLMWLVSQVRPVFIERALLASAIMFCLWIGYLIAHQTTPIFEKILLSGLILIGAFSGIIEHVESSGFPYAPYEEVGMGLMEVLTSGEVVIHSNKISFLPMYYFWGHKLNQTFVADEQGSVFDTLAIPTQRILGFQETPSLEMAIGDRKSFYFLIFQAAIDELLAEGLDAHPHLVWLETHFSVDDIEQVGDLWIYHFVKK